MAEESPVMGHEAPRAASAAFDSAGGVIGWVDRIKRVCAKLTGLAGGYENERKTIPEDVGCVCP